MKSLIFFSISAGLLLFCTTLFSQRTGDRGLLLGFNTSSFTGTEPSLEQSTYIPGFSIGFFQEFICGEHLILGPELAFTTKGNMLQSVGDLNLHQVITYMELPLLTTWVFRPDKGSRIFISAGPSFDIMLLAFNEVGFPEDINRFDIGLVLGTGIRWSKIRFRILMNQGLLDLDQSTDTTSVRNRTFNLAMGLTF